MADPLNRDKAMDRGNIFWSTINTSPIFVVSGSQVTARVLNTSSEESFTIATPVEAAVVTSSRIATPRLRSNRAGSYLSVEAHRSPATKAETAFPGSLERPEVDGSSAFANAVSDEASVPPLPRNEKVYLTIDSLQNYELIKPIPVIVDSLADKIFTAEVPDLNLSISESSLGGALLFLKDRITTIYEEYRMKKTLDSEQARRLEILQTYIGKTKRNWR